MSAMYRRTKYVEFVVKVRLEPGLLEHAYENKVAPKDVPVLGMCIHRGRSNVFMGYGCVDDNERPQ